MVLLTFGCRRDGEVRGPLPGMKYYLGKKLSRIRVWGHPYSNNEYIGLRATIALTGTTVLIV